MLTANFWMDIMKKSGKCGKSNTMRRSEQPSKRKYKNKLDTCVYKLRDKNTTVYYGTTNNLGRREKEHKDSGKKFTDIEKVSRNMTLKSAKKREAKKLESHRKNHNGKNPKYNKDNDG